MLKSCPLFVYNLDNMCFFGKIGIVTVNGYT